MKNVSDKRVEKWSTQASLARCSLTRSYFFFPFSIFFSVFTFITQDFVERDVTWKVLWKFSLRKVNALNYQALNRLPRIHVSNIILGSGHGPANRMQTGVRNVMQAWSSSPNENFALLIKLPPKFNLLDSKPETYNIGYRNFRHYLPARLPFSIFPLRGVSSYLLEDFHFSFSIYSHRYLFQSFFFFLVERHVLYNSSRVASVTLPATLINQIPTSIYSLFCHPVQIITGICRDPREQ